MKKKVKNDENRIGKPSKKVGVKMEEGKKKEKSKRGEKVEKREGEETREARRKLRLQLRHIFPLIFWKNNEKK